MQCEGRGSLVISTRALEQLDSRCRRDGASAAPTGVIDALRQPTVDGRLQNMSPGVDVNDALFRAVGSRLWNGIPMEDVVAEMVDAAMAKAPSPDWTPEAQRFEIEDMCLRTALKDPKLYPLLTDKYRQQLERLRADGYTAFMVSGNRYGPYIRSAGSKRYSDGGESVRCTWRAQATLPADQVSRYAARPGARISC
jgi:hypothetical protein